jgi:hypothetical protein
MRQKVVRHSRKSRLTELSDSISDRVTRNCVCVYPALYGLALSPLPFASWTGISRLPARLTLRCPIGHALLESQTLAAALHPAAHLIVALSVALIVGVILHGQLHCGYVTLSFV